MTRPTRIVLCCAEHDHITSPDCEFNAKESIVELTDAEIVELNALAADAEREKLEREQAQATLAALKTSARAKLVAGTPLTEEEAATIVL
jgi:hypothetical protein